MLGRWRAVLGSPLVRVSGSRLQSTLSGNGCDISPLVSGVGTTNHHSPVLTPNVKRVNQEFAVLAQLTSGLHLSVSAPRPTSGALFQPTLHQAVTYKLPTVTNSSTPKVTIIDPLATPIRYDLPCESSLGLEQVAPPVDTIHPVRDPLRIPVTRIETMPYLVNIRHKKMKKHKLKKFRKRMIFLHRKLSEIKRKRKEKVLVAFERKFATAAKEFDAEKYIENHIKEAKRGKWKVDVIEQWQAKRAQPVSTVEGQ